VLNLKIKFEIKILELGAKNSNTWRNLGTKKIFALFLEDGVKRPLKNLITSAKF